jgi:hypothetical protein
VGVMKDGEPSFSIIFICVFWLSADSWVAYLTLTFRCNAYNVSTASACLLAVLFGVSLFFDVQDLFASKQSPRTRN